MEIGKRGRAVSFLGIHKLDLLCSARLDVPEDGPELAPQAGLHQHVQVFPVLEGLEQLHDELGVGLLHNFLGKCGGKN